MKEFNKIDELFRSSLADYKPVPEAKSKERFLASATGLWAGSSGSGLNWKYLLLAAVLLLGISGALYMYLSKGNDQQDKLSLEQAAGLNVDKTLTKTPETVKSEDATTVSSGNNNNNNNNNNPKEPESSAASQPVKTTTNLQKTADNKSGTPSVTDKPASATQLTNSRNNLTSSVIIKSNSDKNTLSAISFIPTYVNTYKYIPGLYNEPAGLIIREIEVRPLPDTEPTDEDYKRVRKNSPLNMAYSVHYRPEFVFNIIDNNKLVHNFGIDLHFKLFDDKYIIRTGISSSISKGYYEYAVLYNEYLGSYEGLDSITFQWDDNHYHLIPTYHTSEREVFDTAVQTDVTKVYKRFTYLQIPLMLGYDFITHERFSMGARLGPTLSILLSDNTLSDDYDPGKHRVIQVNQITPDRIETNWMLSAGFNFSFYSKKRLFYEIEPQFSYYFNSVYQKYDVTKPPFSVGIRLSVGIK